jgi:pyruvate/2-oxoglutarate dehydrogenase complex dihydrolipoamide dehydrogenase (E3) component
VSEHEFDVVVLGMGPGGEHIAEELARAGVPVAAVEERLVGGECPYFGCVPSKMMIRAAGLLTEGRRIPGMAGASVISPDWAPVARRIRDEATDNWDDEVAADRFTDAGGTLYRGHGVIAGPGRVAVGDDVLLARRGIVINCGTAPAVPPIPGLARTPFWTNRDIIQTEEVPRSLAVLGGGPVGVELAQVFARFGSLVTVIEAMSQLLAVEEPETGELLAQVFDADGIDVRTGTGAQRVSHDGGRFTVTLAGGTEVRADRLLVATGRRTDLAGLGAGSVGLDEKARTITVDGDMLAAPGVWAIGDVVGHGAFTHMSMYHAEIVLGQLLGRPYHPAEYHAVSRVTFTDPEIGSVGMNEAQAIEKLGSDRVAIGISQIPSSARGWIHKAGNRGFIKLVADAERGVLVGATSAGPTGGEVLSMLTLAVHAAVPVQRLKEMIYAYPTFHRAVQDALGQLM